MHCKSVIEIDKLTKIFKNRRKIRRFPWQPSPAKPAADFVAVDQLSLQIKAGERVAFIGPNGAGKSTTIKMLCGILHPSSGDATVAGYRPWQNRAALSYEIGTVFGQRSQLWQHLSPLHSYELLSHIYNIDRSDYEAQLVNLSQLFDIEALIHQPVLKLSLGERMKCELVASLLHKPKVLFLDEPTIGLDINAKVVVRQLIRNLSSNLGTTVFLTSHDTADIEQVCNRVIVIDHGKLIQDSSLDELRRQYIDKKILRIVANLDNNAIQLPEGAQLTSQENHHYEVSFNPQIISTGRLIEWLLQQIDIQDLEIKDPPMEEIIGAIYGD